METYPTEDITVIHNLTQEERNEKAMELSQKQIDFNDLEDEKKAVAADYKARMDAINGSIKILSRQIKDGYIIETITAEKRRNFERKQWEYYNIDTGELANDPEQYIDTRRVSELLDVSSVTIWDWEKKGILQSYRIGNLKRFKLSEVMAAPKPIKRKGDSK
ncbi:MAG: DNA-binding protein [Hyphomicrobiaceae bacterium]|nr:MAG: DNA-binding protein [Hyphomicrobiaceae bacterium]